MIPKRAIFIFIGLLALIFFISEYTKDDNPFPSVKPIADETLKKEYPALFEHIAGRDAEAILSYTRHEDELVRNLAWRALASTPGADTGELMERAESSEDHLAWFPLSLHELSSRQLRTVEKYWTAHTEARAEISTILGRQGDERSLTFLMSQLDEAAGTDYEYDYALAVSRLMRAHALSADRQKAIVERAFLSEDPQTTRAYLYGYYRDRNRDPEVNPDIRSFLYQQWQLYGVGNSPEVDQFVAGIIPELALYKITLYYNSEEELDKEIQLAVELAQALEQAEQNEDTRLAASILLRHEHPHVAQQALMSLRGKIAEGASLYNYLVDQLLPNPRSHDYVWIHALEVAAGIDSSLVGTYGDRLEKVTTENLYLLPKGLEIYRAGESTKQYLGRLRRIVEQGTDLASLYAITSLKPYWESLPDQKKTSDARAAARGILFTALERGDRAVAAGTESVLADESLFSREDFPRINEKLSAYRIPEDAMVYEAFARLYKDRFEEQAKPVIDSLAAEGYGPLNRRFAEAGWDVDTLAAEAKAVGFRHPNWETFWKLGEHPIWVLETNRGTIKVELNPLSAPATVSAIDSLTRSGAYNGVPFHRVIPNFVIQGGDADRKDGLGSVDFVIPTESSELEYSRGAAGIASSGTDTEGSQYFIMHQWKPHLNGLYTLFGKVSEGMDVVDRIVVGDSVQVAYWQ